MPPPLHHVPLGRIPFSAAAALQSHLVSLFLASKSPSASHSPPPPTLLTAEFPPTYTLGRRERTLTSSQASHLSTSGRASVVPTLRGGQTTFHGPGQLTGYLILDLKTHALSPRCYIRLLEDSVIGTLAHYGIRGFTTADPGVWTSAERKICAVGVHMRRNVTSYGVGLNVNTNLWWFDRIVACGLEGKQATSLLREGVEGETVAGVAGVWAGVLADRLGIEVREAKATDVMAAMAAVAAESGTASQPVSQPAEKAGSVE
ncbi:hypothetical protein BZA05DRAFT_426930 [Tricharina praecox]|uniref:uncharacterized protein n=1 Tax=Tricharina praecox TaxID=43433 RepID=UPI002220E34B|nr:uncharacterized protein BZA05DRAFT_426930 [Tricharina praecox]KAI5845923.1 hypothetical protein BZA05DRAFT_426930 [Tricharina praecox]